MVIAAVPSSFRESEMFLLATGSAAIAVILYYRHCQDLQDRDHQQC